MRTQSADGLGDSLWTVGGPTYDRRMQQIPPAGHYLSKPPKWLWALPVFSMGLLAFVPPIAIAAKTRTSQAWTWAVGLAAVWLVGFSLVGSSEEDSRLSDFGFLVYVAAWIGAVIYALVMGPKVLWPPKSVYVPVGPPPPPPYDPNVAAVAQAQEGRRKREEARELARRDPHMARDLRIGRPDLPRQYDDGGLVDINAAPAEVLQETLGLTPEQSARVVTTRTEINGFEHPDDLITFADLDARAYDAVKDRVILIP